MSWLFATQLLKVCTASGTVLASMAMGPVHGYSAVGSMPQISREPLLTHIPPVIRIEKSPPANTGIEGDG